MSMPSTLQCHLGLPGTITAAFLDRILALLVPLFLAGSRYDEAAARDAVRAILAAHNPRTDQELRLAALIIAFGFGTLDALGKAMDADLSTNQVLRLRGNAVSLNRASHKNQAMLEKLQKQPAPDLAVPFACTDPEQMPHTSPQPDLPDSARTEDLVAFLRAPRQASSIPTEAACNEPVPEPTEAFNRSTELAGAAMPGDIPSEAASNQAKPTERATGPTNGAMPGPASEQPRRPERNARPIPHCSNAVTETTPPLGTTPSPTIVPPTVSGTTAQTTDPKAAALANTPLLHAAAQVSMPAPNRPTASDIQTTKLNRQQRRALERQAEKARQQQDREHGRVAARAARLARTAA